MTCPFGGLALKPRWSELARWSRNPCSWMDRVFGLLCSFGHQLTNPLPKSPPRHKMPPLRRGEKWNSMSMGWCVGGSGKRSYRTEGGSSWGRCLGVSVPSSVAATAAATSGPSHIKALTSLRFGWIRAWAR